MRIAVMTMGFLLATSGMAFAQDEMDDADMDDTMMEDDSTEELPGENEAAPETTEVGSEEASVSTSSTDGGRFRWGISGGGGALLIDPYAIGYGGIDLRFGYQINDMIGVYGQPQLGFYGGDFGGFGGFGGIVGATAVVDFTFNDQFFVGGGAGFGVLNSPSGPEIHLRGGFYPIVGRNADKPRRKGLMIGVDFRMYFTDAGTGLLPMASIGYEAF